MGTKTREKKQNSFGVAENTAAARRSAVAVQEIETIPLNRWTVQENERKAKRRSDWSASAGSTAGLESRKLAETRVVTWLHGHAIPMVRV